MKYDTSATKYAENLQHEKDTVSPNFTYPDVGYTQRMCVKDYPTKFAQDYGSDGLTLPSQYAETGIQLHAYCNGSVVINMVKAVTILGSFYQFV